MDGHLILVSSKICHSKTWKPAWHNGYIWFFCGIAEGRYFISLFYCLSYPLPDCSRYKPPRACSVSYRARSTRRIFSYAALFCLEMRLAFRWKALCPMKILRKAYTFCDTTQVLTVSERFWYGIPYLTLHKNGSFSALLLRNDWIEQ